MGDDLRPNEQDIAPKIYAENGQVIIRLPPLAPMNEPAYIRMNPLQATLFATEMVKAVRQATR